MGNSQTAVEWLIEQLKKGEVAHGMFNVKDQENVFEQAREMEKEQIIRVADSCSNRLIANDIQVAGDHDKSLGENYYDDTFKK